MIRSSVVLLLMSLASAAQERPKLPPDLDHIVEVANAAPPEFAADAFLRVAAVKKIDATLRRELIDRAFHAAMGAQFRTPLLVDAKLADTAAGMTAKAVKLNLDTLSLQTRAVLTMLPIDKRAARELFLEVGQPSVEAPCDQPQAQIAALYDALTAVANQTFSDQERKKEEHLNLVMSYMSLAASGNEVAPLERMIAALDITPAQRDVLATRLETLRQSLATRVCPPSKPVELASRPDAFWQSESAKRIFKQGLSLRYKSPETLYSEAERNAIEWGQRLADYMKDLADWRPSDEKDDTTYYHEKAIVYEMLVELVSRGPERDKAIYAYVDFVANSSLQREKPVDWFFHVESLVDRVRNAGLGEPVKVFEAFENSGNPVLLLYTLLDKLGRGPQT